MKTTHFKDEREFQDLKMDILYHAEGHTLEVYSPLHSRYTSLIYGRYLQFGFLKLPLKENRKHRTGLPVCTAQGGGGSFKDRKPIGEVRCCESWMAEQTH